MIYRKADLHEALYKSLLACEGASAGASLLSLLVFVRISIILRRRSGSFLGVVC